MAPATARPLDCYIHDESTSFRLEIAGSLCGSQTLGLEQSWRTASSVIGNRPVIVTIRTLDRIDSCGRALLRRWHQEGARLLCASPLVSSLVGSILGERRSATPSIAWEEVIYSSVEGVEQHLSCNGTFLLAGQAADRRAEIEAGEVVTLQQSCAGRVHHWVAAAFMPAVALTDVIHHWTGQRDGGEQESCFVEVDQQQAYSIALSTRTQRIDECGGVVCGLLTIASFVGRDGGVYLELEAFGLRPEVPPPVRWLLRPLLRMGRRASLLGAIRAVRKAVRANPDLKMLHENDCGATLPAMCGSRGLRRCPAGVSPGS